MRKLLMRALLVISVTHSIVHAGNIPDAFRKVGAEHQVPAELLYLMARTSTEMRFSNGSGQPWPWTIAIDGRIERYPDRLTATRALKRYAAQEWHSLSVGLLQLDWALYRKQATSASSLLDPWLNLRLGAMELHRLYLETDQWSLAAAAYNYHRKPAQVWLHQVNRQNQQKLTSIVDRAARRYRVAPELIHAVISAESAFDIKATSPVGAQGLMQLMPGTAKRFGVTNPYEPEANIEGGTRYLRLLLDTFQALPLALAAYNAGENTVRHYGYTIPPYSETRAYVPRVLAFYRYFLAQQVNG